MMGGHSYVSLLELFVVGLDRVGAWRWTRVTFLLDRGGLGDVRRYRDRPPTRGRNRSDQRLGRIAMRSIVHAYGGAALREEPRRCSAEAAGTARHHRHLVAPFHHIPSSKAGSACRPAVPQAAVLASQYARCQYAPWWSMARKVGRQFIGPSKGVMQPEGGISAV